MTGAMNAKIVLLLVGLLVGGIAGWLTRPNAAEIQLGPVSVEVKDEGGSLTGAQAQHVALFALLGAVAGFGIGFVFDRRR